MKIIAKIFLSLLFILFFIIFSLSLTFKFQFLNENFWLNTFGANGTYIKLSQVINDNLENQVVSQGGKASDVKVLTDLVTPMNLEDIVDKNIENFLGFVNGKNNQIMLYLPVSEVPSSLIPKSSEETGDEISLQEFLKEANINLISDSQIENIRVLSIATNIALFSSTVLLILILLALYKLTDQSKRFGFIGGTLLFSGILIFIGAEILVILRTSLANYLPGGADLARAIVGVTIPPLLEEILRFWLVEAIIAFGIGILLFFVKKPYNRQK
ncbi:MAG: hypothetical protein ABSC49_02260 [Candidatus Microgenomates bacterium]|jgi:hypothetical protein